MGRWANNKANNDAVADADAILELNTNPQEALQKLAKLTDEAAKHDRGDAAVMREIIENHNGLAG